MRTESLRPFLAGALFWGSLWGMAEATLGHLLHLAPIPGLAGLFMFPIGAYFMNRAARQKGSPAVILGIGPVAAAIKLADLFLPAQTPFSAINPALAILLEAGAVYLLIRLVENRHATVQVPGILLAAAGWRWAYLLLTVLTGILFSAPSLLERPAVELWRFLALEPLVNTALIAAVLLPGRGAPVRPAGRLTTVPVSASLGLFLIAAGLQILL